MDIICALNYQATRHTLAKFQNRYFDVQTKAPLITRRTIEDAMQDNHMLQALADVLGGKWRSLTLVETLFRSTAAQTVMIPISGRDNRDGEKVAFNVLCYLLTDKQQNHFVMFLGQNAQGLISDMVIGYRGCESVFKGYCTLLNLSELELLNNAYLYEPDAV